MVVTDKGMMIRTGAAQISLIGRATSGVRVINVSAGEAVASLARLEEVQDEEAQGEEAQGEEVQGEVAQGEDAQGEDAQEAPSSEAPASDE